jgi:hypothetical protein
MTRAEKLKRSAKEVVSQLRAIEKLIDSLAKGIPAPKVRPKRKKSVKRKSTVKKRAKRAENYDESLWDFVGD